MDEVGRAGVLGRSLCAGQGESRGRLGFLLRAGPREETNRASSEEKWEKGGVGPRKWKTFFLILPKGLKYC